MGIFFYVNLMGNVLKHSNSTMISHIKFIKKPWEEMYSFKSKGI